MCEKECAHIASHSPHPGPRVRMCKAYVTSCPFNSSTRQWRRLTVNPYDSSFSAEPGKSDSFSNSTSLTTPLPTAGAGAPAESSLHRDCDPDCTFPSLRHAPSLFLGPFCSQTPSSVHRALSDSPLGAGTNRTFHNA